MSKELTEREMKSMGIIKRGVRMDMCNIINGKKEG